MTHYRTTILAALLSATALSGAYAADPIKIGVVTPLSGTCADRSFLPQNDSVYD